ncbi:hypothetical protein X275_04065 [Marinitoga sp. 1197]|uniref:hypothetical protein n=1 Tax=Marinitoga sp. 1197 TaxID=1428449 RepID=UPI000641047C|nr:hypothetical protein [Marinitoga sp. 1197]KLO23126.1 hypothetical protein X275_04065 [Marinitoga sp. 1197]
MVSGIVYVLMGIIILTTLILKISFTISTIIEIILATIFIFDGLKLFKKIKSENLGNLFFGIILIFDLFNFFNFKPSVGELVLLYIGAQLLASGMVELFFRDLAFKISKNKINHDEKIFELKNNNYNFNFNFDFDWNKCNITTHDEDNIKIKSTYNKSIFNQKIHMGNTKFDFKEKLRINSINIPERAENKIYISNNIKANFDIQISVCDLLMDFYEIKAQYVKINSKASNIHLIPSSKTDSTIDMNIQVSNLTIEIPVDTFVIINFIGDLTVKELNNFIQKDDSTLVSNNFEKAKYTCKINISSEMSKISAFID